MSSNRLMIRWSIWAALPLCSSQRLWIVAKFGLSPNVNSISYPVSRSPFQPAYGPDLLFDPLPRTNVDGAPVTDVMCTGHHAAVSGGVGEGMTVAVVGDGAVGLCAVLAAKRLGAARIIAVSRNPTRQAVAREFGATDIVAERGDAAVKAILEMTDGLGVEAALECVGTGESMATAFAIARAGSVVGAVGAPHDVVVPIETVIFRNVGLRGGVAPGRRYISELLADVLAGRINPGRVLDFETDLDHIRDAYVAMDERRAIKALVSVGTP
jgi:threonine dehydrogenase-like Zn-dependent dehydrogenase